MFFFISMFLKPTWQFWCELSLWGMNRCEWYDENDRKKIMTPDKVVGPKVHESHELVKL